MASDAKKELQDEIKSLLKRVSNLPESEDRVEVSKRIHEFEYKYGLSKGARFSDYNVVQARDDLRSLSSDVLSLDPTRSRARSEFVSAIDDADQAIGANDPLHAEIKRIASRMTSDWNAWDAKDFDEATEQVKRVKLSKEAEIDSIPHEKRPEVPRSHIEEQYGGQYSPGHRFSRIMTGLDEFEAKQKGMIKQRAEEEKIAREAAEEKEFGERLKSLDRMFREVEPAQVDHITGSREARANIPYTKPSRFKDIPPPEKYKLSGKEPKQYVDMDTGQTLASSPTKNYIGRIKTSDAAHAAYGAYTYAKDSAPANFVRSHDKSSESVNKELDDLWGKHEKDWKKKEYEIRDLIATRDNYQKAIDSKKLSPFQEAQYQNEINKINRRLTDLGIENAEKTTPSTLGIQLERLKAGHESEHLKAIRDREKKYGIKEGGRYSGSFGGGLAGINSLLGLSDESGFGVFLNILAWPITWWITVYGIVGPVMDTFSFFIPFLGIVKYPIYLVGMIILHPFIKAILYPFKEDVFALFEHEDGYWNKKRRGERAEENRKEKEGEIKEEVKKQDEEKRKEEEQLHEDAKIDKIE